MPGSRPRGLRFPLPVVLSALLAICLQPIAGTASAQEILVSPGTAEDDPVLQIPPLDLRFVLAGGVHWFLGDDMDATYGATPRLDLGLTLERPAGFQWFASVGYASTTGDPYHDLPEFDADGDFRLRFVPIRLGIRFDLLKHPRHRLFLGGGGEIDWIEAELPGAQATDGIRTERDWGSGFWMALTHEIRLDGTLPGALGLDLSWARGGADPGPAIDLSGVSLRLAVILDP